MALQYEKSDISELEPLSKQSELQSITENIEVIIDPNDLGSPSGLNYAKSDPLATSNTNSQKNKKYSAIDSDEEFEGRESIFTRNKRHLSTNAIGATSIDPFKEYNTRELSTETISVMLNGTVPLELSINVPARDNLIKIPFHSTPIYTNNAFYEYRERMNEMGFHKQAEAALVCTQCESVEAAVSFILINEGAIWHRFGVNYREKESKLCTYCGLPYIKHLIDENGQKIEFASTPDATPLDVSMILGYGMDFDEMENAQSNADIRAKLAKMARTPTSQLMSPPTPQKSDEKIDDSVVEKYLNEIVQNTEESIVPYTGPTTLCMICFDERPNSHFIKSECGHDYCKDCLQNHYKIKTKDGDVLKVKCIDPNCDREIREEEILQFLTDDALKQKFLKFKRQKLLMLNENARFCPMPNCEGYMIGSRLKPKLECPECKTKICFKCSKLWHGYFTKCSSVKNETEDGINAFYEWESNKDVKKCPKCRMRIEKNEGCNHMTCVSCKYEFCWICRGKYSENHFAEWNIFGCPGAQYNDRRVFTIQNCPSCIPIWLRRLLVIFVGILLLPFVIVFGLIAGTLFLCCFCCGTLAECVFD